MTPVPWTPVRGAGRSTWQMLPAMLRESWESCHPLEDARKYAR